MELPLLALFFPYFKRSVRVWVGISEFVCGFFAGFYLTCSNCRLIWWKCTECFACILVWSLWFLFFLRMLLFDLFGSDVTFWKIFPVSCWIILRHRCKCAFYFVRSRDYVNEFNRVIGVCSCLLSIRYRFFLFCFDLSFYFTTRISCFCHHSKMGQYMCCHW